MQILSLVLIIIVTQITAENNSISEKNYPFEDSGPKIIGGTPVLIDEIPYQVSIRNRLAEERSYGSGHLCGGSLISQRAVLTAAHCCYIPRTSVKRAKEHFLLVMGNTYLNKWCESERKYLLADIKIHSGYDSITFANDIAIMFIDGVVPWMLVPRSIELTKHKFEVGTVCQISGWGYTSVNHSTASSVLLRTVVPILDNEGCIESYPTLRQTSEICAGYMAGNIDSCRGDSGGPLVCQAMLVGIVSYGNGCALRKFPGIYQSVFYFYDWIIEQNGTLKHAFVKSIAEGSLCRCWHCFVGLVAFLYDAAY